MHLILPPSAVADQVPEILRQVDDARKVRQEHCVSLLSGLAPRLLEVKMSERDLDLQQAPRFNSFDYLRKSEIGLSRVIADLLNPRAKHGQGTSFLEKMLNIFPEKTLGWRDGLHSAIAGSVRVRTERWIPEGGQIDITVDIPSMMGRSCLAFENKPFASDQPGQIIKYLRFLRKQYDNRFLLVYLPPVYRWPDEISFPRQHRERWRGHFSIMPYIGEGGSLEEWLVNCYKVCKAERVRWFLKDAQAFCQQQFGETRMSLNPDVRFVRDYLSNNPSQLRAALAIRDAWTPVRDDVCRRFLEHLRKTIDDRKHEILTGTASDCHVQCRYEGDRKYSNYLVISRNDWMRYDEDNLGKSTQIRLESIGPGPVGWNWGVRGWKPINEMTDEERTHRENLSIALHRHGLMLAGNNKWWPQLEQGQRYQNWEAIMPELVEECKAGGGEITDFYVYRMLEIARCAIPAIDEIEMANRPSSG